MRSGPAKKTRRSGEAKWAFIFTAVPGSLMIRPAFWRPMKAMKRPMPVAMPFLRLGLTALKMSSRRPTSERMRKSGDEDRAEGGGPGIGKASSRCGGNGGEDEEEIFAHSGGLGDGIAGIKGHDGCGQGGGEAGGGGDCAEIHPCGLAEHRAREDAGWTKMM